MGWQGLHPWARILQISPLQTGGETPLGSGGVAGHPWVLRPPSPRHPEAGMETWLRGEPCLGSPTTGPPIFPSKLLGWGRGF